LGIEGLDSLRLKKSIWGEKKKKGGTLTEGIPEVEGGAAFKRGSGKRANNNLISERQGLSKARPEMTHSGKKKKDSQRSPPDRKNPAS